MRTMLKGKVHRALVTEVNLDYEGSITIDSLLMEEADILPYEMVHILNLNNGARFETYAIAGEPGSGEIVINGAAARLASVGDPVIILAYSLVGDDEAHRWQPRLVYVDERNEILPGKEVWGAGKI